jgi:hypothetical protein
VNVDGNDKGRDSTALKSFIVQAPGDAMNPYLSFLRIRLKIKWRKKVFEKFEKKKFLALLSNVETFRKFNCFQFDLESFASMNDPAESVCHPVCPFVCQAVCFCLSASVHV